VSAVADCLLGRAGEGLTATDRDKHPYVLEQTADRRRYLNARAHELGSGPEHAAYQMAAERFDFHLPVPACSHELGQTERVVLVGRVDLHAQPRLGMARIQAHQWQPEVVQRVPEPCRERPRFETDALGVRSARRDCVGDHIRLGLHLPAPDLAAVLVDHADGGILLRNVQANELRHGDAPPITR